MIKFTSNEPLTEDEKHKYIDYVQAKHPKENIKSIDLDFDGEEVNITYVTSTWYPFERIRRITGYLTGDTKTWNKAKAAEERARVKHL